MTALDDPFRDAVAACVRCPRPHPVTEACPSPLASGAIARGLADAAASHQRTALAQLIDLGPWDD